MVDEPRLRVDPRLEAYRFGKTAATVLEIVGASALIGGTGALITELADDRHRFPAASVVTMRGSGSQ